MKNTYVSKINQLVFIRVKYFFHFRCQTGGNSFLLRVAVCLDCRKHTHSKSGHMIYTYLASATIPFNISREYRVAIYIALMVGVHSTNLAALRTTY